MKILVPIDNSECSWKAINSLSERTWPQAVEFRIVTVVPYYRPGAYWDESPKTRGMLNNYGDQLVQGTVAQLEKVIGHAKISGKILIGGIASSIIQEAMEWKPDLIIMGSHDRKGIQKFILGSTAEDIAKQVTCKVEIVKQTDEPQ